VSPPSKPVLVLNAGSSSLKYQVVSPATGEAPVRGHVDRIGTPESSIAHEGPEGRDEREEDVPDHDAALRAMSRRLDEAGVRAEDLLAVGHRVVHGGPRFTGPTLVDDDVLDAIEDLSRLAPLHNPPAVAGIRSSRASYPGLPQVAVFDTAFFADLPVAAATYALDRAVAEREQVRRYGMHGTSHAYVAGEVARFLGRDPAELDQILLHLGNGASAAALRGGRPVDTSMGLTPLEGLVMGTRAGDVDPGVLVHLLRHGGPDGGALDVDGLEDLLHHRSGLQGLAGAHDFREVLAAVDAGDESARTAYDVYCHRIRKYVGAYLAVLDGADVLTFTAGVGENVPRVRAHALSGLDRLGIEVDPQRNDASGAGPRRISTDGSRVAVLVVPTNEELSIARQASVLLA
jgi:acetate kinase